ncbi:cystatin-A5-like [Parambassis ranga]|uniref:Cystatin-B n=1 Tax=Parambassis ranga TaxID=210632 RepID=A0A6P7KLW5_9TELE|nr:cystatin-A5-like [Parambassis ranga]
MAHIGGFTDGLDATEETQKICDEVKDQVQERTKKTYEEFRAIQYRKQIVAGANYIIKVYVGGFSYLCVKVYQHLDGVCEVIDVQDHKKDDTIIPF